MESEILLLTRVIISLLFLTILSQFSKEWLYSSIVVNFILIGMLGAKTISFFGFTTNSGNVFYASLVFALYLLIEHHGKDKARKSIYMAAVFSLFSLLMVQLVINTVGTAETRIFDTAMHILLQQGPRLAAASIAALLLSQTLNLWLYGRMLERAKGKILWLRNIVSLTATQFLDSAIFFSIAFFGILSTPLIIETMVTGFVLKVAIGILGIPFLYLSLALKKHQP